MLFIWCRCPARVAGTETRSPSPSRLALCPSLSYWVDKFFNLIWLLFPLFLFCWFEGRKRSSYWLFISNRNDKGHFDIVKIMKYTSNFVKCKPNIRVDGRDSLSLVMLKAWILCRQIHGQSNLKSWSAPLYWTQADCSLRSSMHPRSTFLRALQMIGEPPGHFLRIHNVGPKLWKICTAWTKAWHQSHV